MNQALDLSSNQEASLSEDPCCGLGFKNITSRTVVNGPTIWKQPLWQSTRQKVEGIKEDEFERPQTPASLPPAVDPLVESTDALVAQELFNLSLEDRNRVLEEIHGVQDDPGVLEDDKLRRSQLSALATHLKATPTDSAFAMAKRQDPQYVSRDEFCLKFLRAEQLDARKAANRMLAFFEYKLELFGSEKLTKDIGVRDLLENPEDRRTLESGLFQPLSSRDRSGRLVIGKFIKYKHEDLPLESRLRVFYYMLMTTTEFEKDQKRGIVLLVVNHDGIVNRMDAWRNTTLLGALPVRINAFHSCHTDPKITALSALAMLAMGSDYRARFRKHIGSLVENVYSLLTFGMASESIPLHPRTGDVETQSLHRWIERRKHEGGGDERAFLRDNSTVVHPDDADVVFGRGKGIQNHSGNKRLRDLIDSHLVAYERAKLLEKTLIAERIVQEVKSFTGRFLKQVDGGWTEVKDEVAREKISHAFRDSRRKKVRQQE